MSDPFASFTDTPATFGRRGDIITPGAIDLDPIPKAVVMLDFGNITVVPMDNANEATIDFVGVSAGFMPPFRVRRVTAATAACASVF